MAWYTVDDEEGGLVRAAVSRDDGATFGKVVTLDASSPVGRAAVAVVDDDTAIVAWVSGTPEEPRVSARSLTAGGELGPLADLGSIPPGRRGGFPRLAAAGDGTAWLAHQLPARIRLVRLRLR